MKADFSKQNTGTIRVTPDSGDDLWTLVQIIAPQDKVTSTSLRKIKVGDQSNERNVKVVRKPVTLTIQIDKTEFLGETLRLLGPITQGPEHVQIGEYHSFAIEPGTTLSITKLQWPQYVLDRIKEAIDRKPTQIVLCTYDRDEAVFAVATQSNCTLLSRIKSNMPKKVDQQQTSTDFYQEIKNEIDQYVQRYEAKTVVIGTSSFWKRYLETKLENTEYQVIFAQINGIDMNELIRRPEIKTALSQADVSKEMERVDAFLADLAKEKPIAYGFDDCMQAAQAGAIQELLVSEQFVQEQRQEPTHPVEELLMLAQQSQATITFIGNHESGKKIHGLGGVVAFLRYQLNI